MKTTFEQDMMVWCRSPVQSYLVKKCKFQLLHALSPDHGESLHYGNF